MKIKKYYYCDSCNKRLNKTKDHIQEYNPYLDEIENKKVVVDLCSHCYDLLLDEI